MTNEVDRPETGPSATSAEASPSALEPGHVSAFLAELARAPDRDLEVALRVLRPGAVVGKFELVREIGRGGFGVVFEAVDRDLSRRVAFKAIRPGRRVPAPAGTAAPEDAWLRREAEAAAQLAHPNIVTLHDLGTSEDGPYLVLELLRGETLGERLWRGPLSAREALRISIDVARALAHAHAAGVLHRDLKPQNVFLCEGGAVKVLDFGLAHVLGTAPGRGGGTPGYMAPEQWRGEGEDARTDIFAAAVLLHEMLSGELPYPVVDGRSAALDPGPAPVLRRPGVPRALSSLVAAGLAKDPAGRPRNAQVWLDGLFAAERALGQPRSRRARLLGAGAAVLAAAALAASALWLTRPALEPGERIPVSVADFANDTDERDLDGLSGMLITSLEQSRRLSVMTRSRMFDLLRQIGREGVNRIDEPLAREIGRRAGVRALLLASIRRFDGLYRIELRALDPAADEYLFTLSEEGTGKSTIPGMIDRISERTRRELREKPAEVRASEVKVASALTSSLEAYQHYFAGLDCLDHPSHAGNWRLSSKSCTAELRKAIAIDPAFALAHYQLAVATEPEADLASETRDEVQAALRTIERAPPKEQTLIRAFAARVDGKDDEALALYRAVAGEYPADKRILYLAGDLLYHRDDLAGAIPYLEQALALDPFFDWPLDHLPYALGALGRREALAAYVRRWSGLPPTAAVLHALSDSSLWLGQPRAAVLAAKRETEAGGGSAALADLAAAHFHAGDYREAEALLRKLSDPSATTRLAALLAVEGRNREGLRVFGGFAAQLPENPASYHYLRAAYLVGAGDPGPVWQEARAALERAPGLAAKLAFALAYLGNLDHAEELAAGLQPGSVSEMLYRAVVAWKRGDLASARAGLRAAEARNAMPPAVMPPSFLLAEVCFAAGEDGEAVEALLRFQALPSFTVWRGWAYPTSLHLLARAYERLGQRDRARREIERLLMLWRRADPDLGLLADARALRLRLGAGGGQRGGE